MLINKGHWNYNKKFYPEEWFGFVYCIQNRIDNKFYIGKKQFFHKGKKKSRTYGKEMAWRSYEGSSAHVKKEIKKHGKENFSFDIIDLYKTKGGLYYAEAYCQMICECMTRKDKNNELISYNRQIAAIRFIPLEEPSRKTKTFVNKLNKSINGYG